MSNVAFLNGKKPRYRVPYRKTADVIVLSAPTRLDIPAERALRAALDEGLKSVAVLGWCEDGSAYLASSLADGGDLLWLMEIAKLKMMGVME